MSERYEIEPYRPPLSEPGPTPLEMLTSIARVTAGIWLRSASWGVGTSIRLARAAADPLAASDLARELTDGVRGYAREILGISDLEQRLRQLVPRGAAAPDPESNGGISEADALRAQGAELLRRSADVNVAQTGHPAYARILEELAPDEARMLKLLATEGPQPSVDVRAMRLLGLGSELVAEGLTMIGPQAGVRHPERVPAYLNNLYRLGLIWFSKEPLDDSVGYQVLEAQPTVLGAIKSAPRTKTVQRSIGLTPFGRDFCEAALPLERADDDKVSEPVPE